MKLIQKLHAPRDTTPHEAAAEAIRVAKLIGTSIDLHYPGVSVTLDADDDAENVAALIQRALDANDPRKVFGR